MNIHFLHPDPHLNARMLPDIWLRIGLKELAQIMSTVCYVNGTWTENMYQPYNPNGRFVKWGLEKNSWYWMLRYASWLGLEYVYRFSKIHKSMYVLKVFIEDLPDYFDAEEPIEFPEAFRDYKVTGKTVFERYRNYFLQRFTAGLKVKWTKRDVPSWFC